MTSGGQLYPSEGDGAFEGNLDGRLLHSILSVQSRVPRRCCYAAEVPLDFGDAVLRWKKPFLQ